MKKIFVLLFMISSAAGAQVPQYAPDRSKGQVVVTDVALRTKEFLQLPTVNTLNPALGSYPDSNGRIWYNRFDSNLIVRNAGTYIRYFNSQRIMNMDANVLHLTGTETVTGAKTFNGNLTSAGITTVGNDIVWNNNTGYGLKGQDNVRYLSYTTALGAVMPSLRIGSGSLIQPGAPIFTLVGKAWITDTLNAAGLIRPANDIIWANNSGFGLRGSDGVRFLYYTTALGSYMPTLRIGGTTIQNGNPQFTVQGKGWVTDTLRGGIIARVSGLSTEYLMADGSVRTNVTSSIDTGRAVSQIATGGSLNKVRDSITNAIAASVTTKKLIGGSATPTVSGGDATYIGTGASASVTGNDMAGVIILTTGTGCTSTSTANRNAFSVTFSSTYSTSPVVIIQAVKKGATGTLDVPSQSFFLRAGNSGATGFTVWITPSTTLDDSTTYEITYQVIGR